MPVYGSGSKVVPPPTTEALPVRLALVTAVCATLALTGCGAVEDGINQATDVADQAREQIEDTSRNLQYCAAALSTAEAVRNENWEDAVESGENLVETAPEEIADEARTVLDGARAYQSGEDEAAVQTEEFRSAAQRVADFTRETCDPRS